MLKSVLFVAITTIVFYNAVADDCGENEEYVACPSCAPQTCDAIGHTYHCLQQSSVDCAGACQCVKGYVRNNNNECVSAESYCTDSCGGDDNADYGCGINCITCSNYAATNPICPRIKCPGGCNCKPNYVLDTNTKLCVLPEQCSTD